MPTDEPEQTRPRTVTEPDAPEAAWPSGMPYTVLFPSGDGYAAADLEHPAPLPRVGDTVEYLDEVGGCHRFRVREIIHTLQSSASYRPPVEASDAAPNALIQRGRGQTAEQPGAAGVIRAGLPKVLLESMD